MAQMKIEAKEIKWMEIGEKPPTLYCNQFRLVLSQFDVAIDFGEASFDKIKPNGQGHQALPVEVKAHVVMSIQHAKSLLIGLSQQIAKYESDFGEVPLQPKEPK